MQSTQLSTFQTLQFQLQQQICNLNLPTLGPDFASLNYQDCQDALIATRLIKKLSKVESSSTRASESVRAMIDFDENGLHRFSPGNDKSLDEYTRWHIYQNRAKFHTVFQDFKLDFTKFNFPSGESLDPSFGAVSLFDKLRDLKHWKVTHDCRELFIRLVYSNLWFKRAALHHVKRHSFYIKHKKAIDSYLWNQHKTDNDPAYSIFRVKMIQFVLTVVPGARLATVPKDNTKDRVIEIECLGNMCVQRCIARSIISLIEKHYGYDLTMAQDIHKELISDHSNSTVDFSNASNSNWIAVLRFYLPPRVFKLLMDVRSPLVSYADEYYGLNMIAPMGNGFTFEVMSIFLLTIARGFDSLASVFGDDVIIDQDTCDSFITYMKYHGWVINETKSFKDGHFRESCGAFHHVDGYLTSYDFWLAKDEVDAMVCTNKIFVLLDYVTDKRLYAVMKDFWIKAIELFPVRCLRVAKKAKQMEFKQPYVYAYKFSAKLRSELNLPSDRFGRLYYSPTEVYPLERGVLCSTHKFKSLTKICVKTQKTVASAKRKYDDIMQKFQYTSFDICRYPVKDLAEHYSRAPLSEVRSKIWLATYFRYGRVVQPKSGKTIIKYKTVLISGIDLEV